MNHNLYLSLFILTCIMLVGCGNAPEKKATLRDIDSVNEQQNNAANTSIESKSDQEIRQAYADYLANAGKDANYRLTAIKRLTQLEFDLANKLLEEQDNLQRDNNNELDEQIYIAKLDKTIELLSTYLRDYPKASGNDKVLYQLAKAYAQKGDSENANKTLLILSKEHPKSTYYAETQFRLGEYYFSQTDYPSAEEAYTEVLISPKNDIFYEKAIFKRGWSRFKQQFYLEAIDDYLETLTYHRFDDIDKLSKSEQEQFDEYFRVIGLSFLYLGGAESLNDFFQDKPDFKYLYHTYSVVSNIYLKQERYSDAVDTLQQFVQHYPDSENVPYAQLKTIDIWQKSAFVSKLYNTLESFYSVYNSDSDYWKTQNTNKKINKAISKALQRYVLLIAKYFHNQYQKKHNNKAYQNANKWYQRYLKHYSAYAHKDNIYYLYAELLAESKQESKAIHYYELSAYDEELILNKDAAYATIVLSNKLYLKSPKSEKSQWLNKHIKYSLLFSQLYTNDKRTEQTIIHASELAYSSKQYKKTIELVSLINDQATPETMFNASIIRAQSHFKLNEYAKSEAIYTQILNTEPLNLKTKQKIYDGLALAIYKQAENAKVNKDINQAAQDFMRIANIAKPSNIAATGMYDAIALYMDNSLWNQAVIASKRFQSLFPKHKLNRDVTKKLSVAYLNSDQSLKAAEQFEKISSFEGDKDIKMSALWQAAELYEKKKNYPSAIRSYTEYANTYKTPYPQYIESLYKLTEIYKLSDDKSQLAIWRKRIIHADQNAYKQNKTDRTQYIASTTILELARNKNAEYQRYKLIEPLQKNLRKKKKVMQEAVKLYGQASAYGIPETATEATHTIADIYQHFSTALLESERPKSLTSDELTQYNILLEDQAFPFEEKAIEFYEINLSRIQDDIYNDWIGKSLQQLKTLFPTRYARKNKADDYIDTIH